MTFATCAVDCCTVVADTEKPQPSLLELRQLNEENELGQPVPTKMCVSNVDRPQLVTVSWPPSATSAGSSMRTCALEPTLKLTGAGTNTVPEAHKPAKMVAGANGTFATVPDVPATVTMLCTTGQMGVPELEGVLTGVPDGVVVPTGVPVGVAVLTGEPVAVAVMLAVDVDAAVLESVVDGELEMEAPAESVADGEPVDVGDTTVADAVAVLVAVAVPLRVEVLVGVLVGVGVGGVYAHDRLDAPVAPLHPPITA